MSGAQKRAKKLKAINLLYEKFSTYEQILVVSLTNVSSRQMQAIRKALRTEEFKGELVVGKNTLTRKAIEIRMAEPVEGDECYEYRRNLWKPLPQLKNLLPQLKGRVALLFTNGAVSTLKAHIEALTIPCKAKVGQVSPVDVTVKAGPTGLDPSEIKFFHALKITTKIVRSVIQITNDITVLEVGQTVKASEAALLAKLNVEPFEYGMKVLSVYNDGVILNADFVSLGPEDYQRKFCDALKNVNAMSMAMSYHTEASMPSVLLSGFKNLLAVSFGSGYTNERFTALLEGNAQQASNNAKAEEVVEEEVVVEKPKVNLEAMGNMFGDESSSDDDSSDSSS